MPRFKPAIPSRKTGFSCAVTGANNRVTKNKDRDGGDDYKMDILVALGSGFVQAIGWPSIGYITAGVVMGLALGILPGLGGVTGLTLLLPLAFTLDISQALAIMIALTAVTATSDTIPAVLLGVPGSSSAAATVVDGYPMAQQGRAAEALGAAFAASAVGGLFGAFVLVAAIPILRPLVLAFGAPEIFMLAMWGLALVGMLAGRDPLRGWAAAGLGVTLAMMGRDPIHAIPRYTFDIALLRDGVSLIAVALGLFALPELVALSRQGKSISAHQLPKQLFRAQMEGVKAVFKNWFLVMRCSAIGTWIGFLPGLGGNVADWIAYSHGQMSVKDNQNFGKGDVRGVIAPESANNSVKGGDLIPTLAFGVPGSGPMALLFGALTIAGIEPGSTLLGERIDLTMVMVWSLVIANIIGVIFCLSFTRFLARITELPGYLIAAVIVPMVMLSAYAQDANTLHILVMVLFGLLGLFFRQFDWPRPPLLVGFVLGNIVETNFVNSVRLFNWEFLLRPVAGVLFVLLIATFVYGIVVPSRRRKLILAGKMADDPTLVQGNPTAGERRVQYGFEGFLFLIVAGALAWALTAGWQFYSALMPVVFSGFATIATGAILLRGFRRTQQRQAAAAGGAKVEQTSPFLDLLPMTMVFFGWCFALYLGVLLIGFQATIFIGMCFFMRAIGKATWRLTLSVTVGFMLLVLLIYEEFFTIAWPVPWVLKVFGFE
jgi:TctA family transporter